MLNARTDIELSGHGTHVAGIAAGSGGTLPEFRGVAYDSRWHKLYFPVCRISR